MLAAVAVASAARAAGPVPGRRVAVALRPGSGVSRHVAARLDAADLAGVDHPVAVALVAMAGTGAIALVVNGPGAAVAVGLVVGLGLVAMVLARGDRTGTMLERQLPDLAEGLARQFRVGRSLPQALEQLQPQLTHPLDVDVSAAVSRMRRGRAAPEVLRGWARQRPSPDVRLLVTALVLGVAEGGERASAMEAVARSLRDRAAVERELRAQSAQARVSAAVVAGAPVAFTSTLILLGVVEPSALAVPVTAVAMAAGLVLDGIGLWWMRRLARPVW